MLKNKGIYISLLLLTGVLSVKAQSTINSPYTRYGLGDLIVPTSTNNAGFGGVGYALRTSDQVNVMNPASYTSVDSLAFMFDIGLSLRTSNFTENGIKANARNSTFDYVNMQFRLHKRLGMAIGFIPYSNSGYNFSETKTIPNSGLTQISNTFTGEGGLQQIFAGLGFKIMDNLSIGVNFGYLYGKLEYGTTAVLSKGGDSRITYDNIEVRSYKFDAGLQYTQPFNEKNRLTLGLTYSLGHKLNSTEVAGDKITNGSNYTDERKKEYQDVYGIPHTYAGGLMYQYSNKLKIGIDYAFEQWSKTSYNQDIAKYAYRNRQRMAGGIEYSPNPMSRKYLSRVFYRLGTNVQDSYLVMPNSANGPKEYSVSFGFGFPISVSQRNSVFSITGQYTRVKPEMKDMLSENRFMIKLGLTFNERWFMKFKVN